MTAAATVAPVSVGGGTASAVPRSERLLQLVAVLLLGLTTIGTAWCGYQATMWGGVSAASAATASGQRVEAARLFGLATQEINYDSVIIAQYAQAASAKDTKLEEFYRSSLVRAEFKPVLDDWIAQVRSGGRPTPLADNAAYIDSQLSDYRAATAAAEEATRASAEAGSTASAYVSATILLAAALFFSGVVSSFSYRPARAILLALALIAVAFAASRLAMLPVTF